MMFAFAACVAWPGGSDACPPPWGPDPVISSPSPDDSPVPLNVELWVAASQEITLRGPDGEEVPLWIRSDESGARYAAPIAPLTPTTEYRVTGQGRPVVFRTGLHEDTAPPPAVEILNISAEREVLLGHPTWVRVSARLAWLHEPVLLDLGITHGEAHDRSLQRPQRFFPSALPEVSFSVDETDPRSSLCVELAPRDLAGNVGSTVRRCAPISTQLRWPSDGPEPPRPRWPRIAAIASALVLLASSLLLSRRRLPVAGR